MVSLVPYFLAAPTHTKNLNNSNSNDKKKDSSETSTRRSETSDRVTS